jgi:hypothetical protein
MGMNEQIFRKTSMDQISSPEQLCDYIKVTNPGIWMVLGAILLALAALVFWGISATIPTTVSTRALAEGDGRYVCYFPPAAGEGIKPGMPVSIDGAPGQVIGRGEFPLSYREAVQSLPSDYAAYALDLGEWNILVRIARDSAEDTKDVPKTGLLAPVVITKAQTRPIDFFIK